MPVRKQIKIKSVSQMDAETLLKHVNARHTPIGDPPLEHVGPSNVPGDEDEDLLRAWHDKVHDLRDPIDHYHETEEE